MIRPLISAALLLIAGLAAAEPAWYASAIADWNEGIQRADSVHWLVVVDEAGVPRTFFFRDGKVPLSPDKPAVVDAPLYHFQDAPRKEKRRMRVQVGFYPDRFEERDIELVIFEKNTVSTYYVKGSDNWGFTIGRRDRPETSLRSKFAVGMWELYSGHFENHENVNGLLINGRMQAYKPEGIEPAAVSPLTAVVENNMCRGLEAAWEKPQPSAGSQITRGWLPQEFELWEAPLDASIAAPGIWTALYTEAEKQITNSGSFEKAAQYVDWFRATAFAAIDAAGKASASGPADRLTQAESRFVLCRMRHAGSDAEKAFADQAAAATTAEKAARFTAFWRKFMVQELNAYLAEVKTASRLPRLPDHAASNKPLIERAKKALAGDLTASAPAAPESRTGAQAKPRPAGNEAAAQRKIDDILKQLR